MGKLLVYMKSYKKETIFAPLFKLLEASFELMVPLVMAAIIDVGIQNEDKTYLIRMCLLLILLGVIGLVCSLTAQFFAAKAAVGFSAKLREALFNHIQSLSFSQMDTFGTSTLITRMTSDINQVQSGVNLTLRLFLRSPFIVFGAMIMAFTVDQKAALWFVVVIPILCLVVFGIMLISIPLYKKVQEHLDKILEITRENLTGVRVIRAFARESQEEISFQENNLKLYQIQNFVGKISSLMNPITFIIINIALVGLIWTGAIQVDGGIITQGAVVALINYMSQILVELIKMANLIITVMKAIACGNRIQAIFSVENTEHSKQNKTITESNFSNSDYLVFDQVSLQYENAGEEALSQISFSLKKGQTLGVIGGTGSGKTSLIHLIPGFYPATKGTVSLQGKDVKSYPPEILLKKIGIVMQNPALFKGTIEENLKWGKTDATEEELWHALDVAQAREFVEEKNGKLQADILQGGKNLSGGQKQRLTIARALVGNPEILILDDSASALDYTTDYQLRHAIRELSNELTVIVVSQRASAVLHADKIVVLEDGSMVGLGTHEELLQTCDIYQEIYFSQFEKEEK